jgi:hypothetical protein
MERPQIKIEFSFSTSPNYDKAVAIAQSLSGYKSWGEGRKLRHQVKFVAEEAEEFSQLGSLIYHWKSTTFWLNEKECKQSPFGVTYCIRDRLKAYDPNTYCGQDNYWGCRRVAYSLTTGKLDENGAFHFDKKRFLFNRKEELELLAACPFFDKELMLQRLDELDEVIDPRISENWDYYTDYSNTIVGVHFVPPGPHVEIEFATPEERGEKAWRTRIIAIPDKQWVEYAAQGHIPEADIFLEQGWRLVTVVARDEIWYCVLQR